MYKIIGADQKAYGPVSEEQIRHWIAESRVNAQTQIQAEGASDWKPLGSFPEFADAFGANAPVPPAISTTQNIVGTQEGALQSMRGPALALKIMSILSLIVVVLSFIAHILMLLGVHLQLPHLNSAAMNQQLTRANMILYIIGDIIGAVLAVIVWTGASKMQALKNHAFAVTASILAMLPCTPCCVIGLPFGIWALVMLNKPEVKSHFTQN